MTATIYGVAIVVSYVAGIILLARRQTGRITLSAVRNAHFDVRTIVWKEIQAEKWRAARHLDVALILISFVLFASILVIALTLVLIEATK